MFGPGHCFKCYTKEEKYYMYLAGIIFLSFAGIACVYGILHYLIVDRWRWITCPQWGLESETLNEIAMNTVETASNTTASPVAMTTYQSIDDVDVEQEQHHMDMIIRKKHHLNIIEIICKFSRKLNQNHY
jgi:hypothetical protein